MSSHLIHIGYPKAASTFLQKWFQKHPQLYFKHGKIAGFQDAFDICYSSSTNLSSLPKHFVTSTESFSYPTPDAGKLMMYESTDLKYYDSYNFKKAQKNTCLTLKELFPRAKILIVTRGFRDVLMSSYSQFIRGGGKTFFSEFCKSAEQNVDFFYNYNYLIGLYLQNFGKENVIVLPFEMLKENQDLFLTHLEEILEIDHLDFKVNAINKSLSANELYWHARLHNKIALFYSKFGKKVPQKYYLKTVRQLKKEYLKPFVKFIINKLPEKEFDQGNKAYKIAEMSKKNATVLEEFPVFKPYLGAYNLSPNYSSKE